MKKYLFISESVIEGHPDKLCDYISDKILDEYLEQDENSRVAVGTFASKDKIFISGEVLKLKEAIFSQATNYRHFGKDNLNFEKNIEI